MEQPVTQRIYPIGSTLLLPDPSRNDAMHQAEVIGYKGVYAIVEFAESNVQLSIKVDVKKLQYYGK